MLPATFLRPTAHRGLHGKTLGHVENTLPAFEAAIEKGFAFECDLRPAKCGRPLVFHDETLDRLTVGSGPVADLTARCAQDLRFKESTLVGIPTFADLLSKTAGRAPIIAEVKSEWGPADRAFLQEIAALAVAYEGPLALMSFDPDVMTALRELAPQVPRGIISGAYSTDDGGWWPGLIPEERRYRLANLLDSGPADPCFYAYHVKALPTPVTRYIRDVQRLPLFTWTVRTEDDRATAATWADVAIFEGEAPRAAA